jgi:PAS domain S-box-containing protein
LSDRKETLSLLQEISDFLPGVVYQYRLRPDGTSCFPYSSAAIRQIYRVTPEEVREDASKVLAILHPDDLVGIEASIQKSAAELTHWKHEYRVKFEEGTERWLLGNALPSKESDGSVLWNGFITDITERKQADLQKSRLSRALMLLSESNLMLSQSENEHDLMTAVCKLAVETGGYLMAWIGFAENDEAKSVRWVAQSGYEDGYLDSIKVTWSDSELGQGPAGTSIRTGLAVANQDYQNSPQMAPWREAAMRRGYRSSIALPLIINHHVFGVFSTYAADPFAFSDEEIVLLEKLAGNLSYGIEKLRTQVMLQESNEKIRAIFEGSLDGIVLVDAKNLRHIMSNPALEPIAQLVNDLPSTIAAQKQLLR